MQQVTAPKKIRNNINGIILLDKALGLSSNAALQQVKRLLNAKKAGHTGSLDPLATGILPLCFGEATKFSQYLLDADKSYLVTAKLGEKTSTADAEGEIIATRPVPEDVARLIPAILQQFLGTIEQLPPMYSALKHQGQPLYKLARKGIEVERKTRSIKIHRLEVIEFKNNYLTLAVACSKGTYIRTLVEDIGEALHCGAHVTALRRTSIANFSETDVITFAALEAKLADNEIQNYLLPIETCVNYLPKIILTASSTFYFKQGQAIMAPQLPPSGLLQVFTQDNQFIGLGEIDHNGKITPKRLVCN